MRYLLFPLALLLLLLLVLAGAAPAQAEKRVALVIGNGAYQNATKLPNPKNDAEDVAAALKRAGFETIVGLDLTQAQMQDTAIRFSRAAREADVALFYYTGHAMQFAGINYLMPVDAKLKDEADLRRMARVDEIVADLQQAKNLRILVLDSCRDNPLAEDLKRSIGLTRAAALQRGLARLDTPHGMIVAFATQAGRTAADGFGRNSPYTSAFLKHIETQDEIGTIFRRINADVYRETQSAQLPELSLSLIGDFYLRGRPSVVAPDLTQPLLASPAAQAWAAIQSTTSEELLEAFLKDFPEGFYAALARARLKEIKEKKVAVAPQQTQGTKDKQVGTSAEDFVPPIGGSERLVAEPQKTDEPKVAIGVFPKPPEVVAVLTPDEKKAPDHQLAPITDPKLLALAVKNELKRVGCDPGELNSNWDGKARGALSEFNKHAKLNLPGAAPTMTTLDAIRSKSDLVCPEPKKIVQPEKQKTTPGQPTAQKERKPEATKSGGMCFSLGGSPMRCDFLH